MSCRGLSGQSAIEYLMTYGWMLLVVAVTGSAIFATAGDQNVESTAGFDGDVQIDNFGVSNQDELGLEIRDGSGQGITVSRVNVSDPDTGQWIYKEFIGENSIGVGSSKIFELPNVTRSDSGNELEVEVIYDSEGLSNLSEEGTVNGQLELNNTGSFEGLPGDDHQSIDDGSGDNGGGDGLSLMQTVNYTYDDSGDVQINESTAGSDGYQVDLNNDFSNEVEEIKIVEMHGADGGDGDEFGGSGGLIDNASTDLSGYNTLEIWLGEMPSDGSGGWGRNSGGFGAGSSGGGGGSTEVWLDGESEFVAAADAGGGGGSQYTSGAGGGARGGSGFSGGAEGTGFGGDGGSGDENPTPGSDGGQELGLASLDADGNAQDGGSSDGHGWILIEYYS